MNEVPCKTSGALTAQSIESINRATCLTLDSGSIGSINRGILRQGGMNAGAPQPRATPRQTAAPMQSPPTGRAAPVQQSTAPQPKTAPAAMQIPVISNPVRKGQKVLLTARDIDVRIGWNTVNPACDIDVSAFMLGDGDKVPGDEWFVFYSQPDSPDRSVHFSGSSREDRQEISVNTPKLDRRVKKVVFVLTIYEAAARWLNFSMIKDAYIRLLDNSSKKELCGFKITEYYPEVRSMMIGELYEHGGSWKFSAIGNGIGGGLEELCKFYGVEIQ